LLQALVGQILLRRTKDTKDAAGRKIVDLPPIEYFQAEVELDEDTREQYDEVLRISQEAYQTGQVGF
jgi:SWI/SNF-related matrix-associated actin-dependent regulator of chromatin subfamily A3